MAVGVAFRLGLIIDAGYLAWRRQLVFERRYLGFGLLVGGLFAAEFLCVGEALRHTGVGRVVVFLYTAPLFSALWLHFLVADERLGWLQWLGMALAFSGVAVAMLSGEGGRVSLLGAAWLWRRAYRGAWPPLFCAAAAWPVCRLSTCCATSY